MATIRHARQSDASAIAALWNALIRDTAVTFDAAEKPDAEGLIASRAGAFFVTDGDVVKASWALRLSPSFAPAPASRGRWSTASSCTKPRGAGASASG